MLDDGPQGKRRSLKRVVSIAAVTNFAAECD